MFTLIIYLVNSFALLFLPSLYSLAFAVTQSDKGVIAYVSSSVENQEIRLINPDSTQDRVLWSIPWAIHASSRIGTLSWHPDGTELAFDSGHNWQRSMYIRDLFALSPNGTGLRRLTSPPGIEGSSNNPTGTVKFWVRDSEQGDVQIYIEGASEPTEYFAKLSKDYQITQTVTDWGDGVRQYIRLWDQGQPLEGDCHFSEEGWVDIIPGQEVDLDNVPFAYGSKCTRLHSPSWSQDGNSILYQSYPNNHIVKTNSHALPGAWLSTVLKTNSIINSKKYYRAVYAPTAARKNEVLLLFHDQIYDFIFHMNTEDGVSPNRINLGLCPEITCSILDIAWLPDGSGFMFSQREAVISGYNSVLYRYTFSDNTLTAIIRLPGENIGRLAISPDGTSIVFERIQSQKYSIDLNGTGPGIECPCALWIANIDGSGMRQLVADGRAPAWGKTSSTITTVSAIDEFYNWAETKFPQYFSPHQTSKEILGYYARHYPTTNIYLGTKARRVYVYGSPFGGLLDAGDLQGWLEQAGQ